MSNRSQAALSKIYAGAVAGFASIAAAALVTKVWELTTGDQPPRPEDPEVPLRRAITWAVASGIGIGVAQLLINRVAAAGWRAFAGSSD